ncbi:hypothetical protein [Agaribacterium sp. ZY112]|uniref:hypothetical protein n=1 Tax=Agaribacterium sp. ZY112 TaxID=3233574 RepID=UPI003525CFFF
MIVVNNARVLVVAVLSSLLLACGGSSDSDKKSESNVSPSPSVDIFIGESSAAKLSFDDFDAPILDAQSELELENTIRNFDYFRHVWGITERGEEDYAERPWGAYHRCVDEVYHTQTFEPVADGYYKYDAQELDLSRCMHFYYDTVDSIELIENDVRSTSFLVVKAYNDSGAAVDFSAMSLNAAVVLFDTVAELHYLLKSKYVTHRSTEKDYALGGTVVETWDSDQSFMISSHDDENKPCTVKNGSEGAFSNCAIYELDVENDKSVYSDDSFPETNDVTFELSKAHFNDVVGEKDAEFFSSGTVDFQFNGWVGQLMYHEGASPTYTANNGEQEYEGCINYDNYEGDPENDCYSNL